MLAPRPPRSSVLPPGAGNKAEKAVQPNEKRADEAKERYVDQATGRGRHVHAATIRRHDDGDWAAIPSVAQTHGGGLRCAGFRAAEGPCGSGSLACPLDRATTHTAPHCTGLSAPIAWSGGESGLTHALQHSGDAPARSSWGVRHSRAPGHPGAFARGPSPRGNRHDLVWDRTQNERTVEIDGPFSSTVAAYPPRCLPAVTRRKDVGDAGQHGDRGQHPQSLKPDKGPHVAHHQKSQRMPAPSVRAMDATSARTQVKRTRLVFTSDSVSEVVHSRTGDRAVFPLGRSLALRPRLATGLPWTVKKAEDVRPHHERYVRPGPGHMGRKY